MARRLIHSEPTCHRSWGCLRGPLGGRLPGVGLTGAIAIALAGPVAGAGRLAVAGQELIVRMASLDGSGPLLVQPGLGAAALGLGLSDASPLLGRVGLTLPLLGLLTPGRGDLIAAAAQDQLLTPIPQHESARPENQHHHYDYGHDQSH